MQATDRAQSLDAPRKAIAFVFGGVLLFSLQDVAIKWISGGYPVHEIVLIRSLAAIWPILLLVQIEGGLRLLRTRRPLFHLVRAGVMLTAYTCFYLSVAAMPLADAVAIAFVAPLFVTALSALLLREQVGLRRWLAVAVGFVGVLIMMQPGSAVFEPAALLAVAGALAYALGAVATRSLGATERGSALAFYPTAFYLGAGALAGLALGDGRLARSQHASLQFLLRAWILPSWTDLGIMILCGLFAAFGMYAVSQAYRITRATAVAPFEYIAVPLSVLWGFLFWRDLPTARTVLGIGLIVGSGLYVLWRESSGQAAVAQKSELQSDDLHL